MSQGYFSDTEYIDYFYEGMSPWALDYLAAIHGFPRSDLAAGFHYCELGCGTGLSLVIHAAANPGGHFVGIDLNHEHIRRAEQTAQAGSISNVTFLEEDFSHLLERDLPRFDVIALHGVYSWVSPGIRREIQAFIAHRLQPGGKVYLSYNALPGWAQQAPIRQILTCTVEDLAGSTLDKVAKGLDHLRLLRDAQAPSVIGAPQVKALVEHILTADPRYLAHEYFTAHWEPFYFSQVAEDMHRLGLHYLGCLPVALNYGAFCLPEKLQGFFAGLPTRLAFETHKDLVLNTVFRRDVFCLGQNQQASAGGDRLAGVRLGSFKARADFEFTFEVKSNSVSLDGDIFPRLADLLAGTGVAAEAVLRHPSLAGFRPEEILEGLECLLISGQVLPFAPGPAPARTGLSALNRHLLERDLPAGQSVSLASLTAGTGVTLSRTDALVLYGIAQAGLDQAPAWIQDWSQRHQLQLFTTEGAGPLEQEVRNRAQHLPLAQLGIG